MKYAWLFLILCPLTSFSQVNVDSLMSIWNNEKEVDTNRLNAMKTIAWSGYLFTEPDSAFYFAQKSYDFAKEKNQKKFMSDALNTQGVSFAIKGDYASAMKYYKRCLKINEEMGDDKRIAASLNNIGNNYLDQGDFSSAIDYHTKSLKIKEKIDDLQGVAYSLNNIGLIHQNQRNFDDALVYFTKGLKIYKKLDISYGIALSHNNIGLIYSDQNKFKQAIDHFLISLKIKEATGDKRGAGLSYNNIGDVYAKQKDYASALDYFKKSLKIREETMDKKGISGTLNNIGIIYENQGKHKEALFYSQKSYEMAKEISAISVQRDAAKNLWTINKKRGNYAAALAMHELYIEARDSILSEQSQKEVVRQEYKYKYEKQAAADSVFFAKEQEISNVKIEKNEAELAVKQNQQYALFGGISLIGLFTFFLYNRFKVTRKQKDIIEGAHSELSDKNQEILSSINYAKRIQTAILPTAKQFEDVLPNSFVLYKPKDIVAGDFYWLENANGKILLAAADCTGHGVPGAMVSVICNNGLKRSVREYDLLEPGQILNKTREIVIEEFEKSEEEVKDGMDIALVCLDGNKLSYSGANNPLWIIRNGSDVIEEIKADKQPIGKFMEAKDFNTHNLELNQGDTFYLFSDGFIDQFGGERGKKFKSENFKRLLLSIQTSDIQKQQELLNQAFEEWKGELEQLDDVCVIGVRV